MGKSTLVKFIISALKLPEWAVVYVAYTGKAAQVLREKGCKNSMTAHRLLYKVYRDEKTGVYKFLKKPQIGNYKMIVCDEVSMMPKEMWDLLLSHGIHVLCLGDPAQLAPLSGKNDILEHPHIFLTEVMRQAQESEIIRLSMAIRNEEPIKPFKGKEVNILPRSKFINSMLFWADTSLCALNNTRRLFNQIYRIHLYGEDLPEPVIGDKLICLKNDWKVANAYGDALVNGSVGYLSGIEKMPNLPFLSNRRKINFIEDKDSTSKMFMDLEVDWKLITTGEPTINEKNWRDFPPNFKLEQFDYGYCVTCWKAQGSEYNKVLLYEEDFPYKREDHKKFLYTGVTRAVNKLTLIVKD